MKVGASGDAHSVFAGVGKIALDVRLLVVRVIGFDGVEPIAYKAGDQLFFFGKIAFAQANRMRE